MKKLILIFLFSCGVSAQDVVIVDKATAAQNKRISSMMPKQRDHYHDYTRERFYKVSKESFKGSRYSRSQRYISRAKTNRVQSSRFKN